MTGRADTTGRRTRARRGRAALLVVPLLVPVAILLPGGAATAAGGADSGDAPSKQQLAQMRSVAAASEAKLAAGAKQLDQARARQATLSAKAANAQKAAAGADTELAGLREQIAGFAGSLYENPTSDLAEIWVSGADPEQALQASSLLNIVNAGRTRVLREAAVVSARAAQARVTADQAAKAAADLQRSIDAQVAELRQESATAAARLTAAQQAYDAEQARLAAAAAAREKATREAAARAVREVVAAGDCVAHGPYPAGPWGGYSNGLIPASQLCAITGGGELRPDAAVAFNAMSAAYRQAFGSYLCVTASYRPYSEQVRLFRIEPSYAAVPGRSNHGWGLAVDLGCGVQHYGSRQFRWLVAHAAAFGWVHPAWANHRPFEPWHWEFGHLGGDGTT